MKLLFLGTGSAFTTGEDNYHSNMVLSSPGGNKLLIDCGSDARLSLQEQGITYKDIQHVYISHLHGDHVGGLEWLGFTHKFDPTMGRPKLYVASSLIDPLWNQVLAGGMRSLQGEIAQLSSYFDVHEVNSNGTFTWDNLQFRTVQTVHVMDGFKIAPSFGLIFEVSGKKIFITTDTQFAPSQITDFYVKADLIFHDCETAQFKSGVHAHYTQLKTLSPEIRQKMWLYHYNPHNPYDAVADGFKGFVVKGQEFDLTDDDTF